MEAIMAANLASPLSLDRIASMLGLSAKQLRNRCQKCREATPARVYLSLRLAHARDLVEGTALPVAEIAAAAGFASASSFTRAFREAFGQSPRARRNPLRDDGSLGTWDLSTGTSAPSAAHA
jgi:transcriptional regulator GlxA family with amidase domain